MTTVSKNLKIKVEKIDAKKLESLGIKGWPIWTKEASKFDWFYEDVEQCYFLEGDVIVETMGESVSIGKGDFVTFPKRLQCTWNIKKAVRKHYQFG